MNHALARLIAHAISTLPQPIEERKRMLQDALACLKESDPMAKRIRVMLDFLESHERQQLEFTKLFPILN